MTPIQIAAIVLVFFFLSRVAVKYRKGDMSLGEVLFWSGIWAAMLVIALVPGIAGGISDFFGVGRPIDFIVYVSIIALFYLIFKLYVKIHELEQNTTRIVREIAKERKK